MANFCKACKKPLVWIQTLNGKWTPCDEGLVPFKRDRAGKDILVSQTGEMIRCRLQFEGKPDGVARVPHFATCPEAKRFKNRNGG